MLLYLYSLYFVLSSWSPVLTLMHSTQRSVTSVTFVASVCSYMCNFPESYPAAFTRMLLKGRVQVTSVGWSGITPNWIFKATACLFWEDFFLVLLFCWFFFSPLLCWQFSDNLQTYGSEKNCSHSSSSCCHLVAEFSK